MPGDKLNPYFNDFVLQQRSFYETVAALAYFRNDRSRFLNLGYQGDVEMVLLPEDAPDRLAMNLYFKTLEGVEIKKVQNALEIGCGRGGGCYILRKYFNIPKVSGLDMTYFNLQNARRNTKGLDIEFIHLNVLRDTLPAEKKYDLLLSVDTCQTYQDFERFLSRIRNYMHPSSTLAYSDFAFEEDIDTFKHVLHQQQFEILHWEDLTDAMCLSMTTGEAVEKKLPLWQRILLGRKLQRYLAWSSSEIESLLHARKLRYIRFLARLSQNT